jgi:hypothetical protein
VDYLCRANPEFLQNGLCFFEFGRSALAFQRQQLTVRPEQRQRPPGETFERSDRPRRDHIGGVLTDHLLGSRPAYGDVRQAEKVDALLKEDGTPQQRLQQRDRQIGPHDREDDAGQSRARTHVDDLSGRRDEFAQYGAVENVPFPETLDLTGTDEAPLDAWAGQELGVALGDGKSVPEDLTGRRGYGK